MRLSDAGLRRRQTKLIYPNHRLPPWSTEDDTRDRSNRLLDARVSSIRTPPAPLDKVGKYAIDVTTQGRHKCADADIRENCRNYHIERDEWDW